MDATSTRRAVLKEARRHDADDTLRTIEWLEERARQAPPNEMVHRQAAAELRWRLPDDHEQHPRNHGRLVR